jgi:hypothetical protein
MYTTFAIFCLLGTTIIWPPAGSFDYLNYAQLKHVVSGTIVSYSEDSLTVRVNRVWTGPSQTGNYLSFYRNFEVDLGESRQGLFMADSLGKLCSYGLERDGFYIMVGQSSPNIISYDILRALASGEEPQFNQHKSVLTVHFPLSSEEIVVNINPLGDERITDTEFPRWDGRRIYGTLCTGPVYLTEFGMHRSQDAEEYDPFSLAGDVSSYHDNTYYLDLWPEYPTFSSIDTYNMYYEHGTIPLYTFSLEPDIEDGWPIGLPDDAYLLSDGRDFFLTGRQTIVSRIYSQRNSNDFDMTYELFTTSGGTSSNRSTLLRLEGLNSEPLKPLLITILEAVEHGEIHGSLYSLEPSNSEPVFYSRCTLEFNSPRYSIEETGDVAGCDFINGSFLSFTDTGRALLNCGDVTCTQIFDQMNTYGPEIKIHNSALFSYPDDENLGLLLHISSISSYSNHAYLSDFLVARLIEQRLLNYDLDGVLYEVNLSTGAKRELTTFSLIRM